MSQSERLMNEYTDQLRVIDWLDAVIPAGRETLPHGAYQWSMARLLDTEYSDE